MANARPSQAKRAGAVSEFVNWVRDVAESDFAAQAATQATTRPRPTRRPSESRSVVEPVVLDDAFSDLDLSDYDFEPDPEEWQ